MSFKSEAIIDLKDLFPAYIFESKKDEYMYNIHNIDMYSGLLQNDHIFDIENIDDDVQSYKDEYPKWSEAKLKSEIENNIGYLSNEKWKEVKKEMGDFIRTTLLPSRTAAALGKYGVLLVDTKYTTPREYNFRSDSLELHLEDVTPSDGDISPEIHEIMEQFLKEAPRSCDGYINLLPNSVEECKRLDIPHIFAILHKECILEDVMNNIGEYLDDVRDLLCYEGYGALKESLDKEYNKEFCGTFKTAQNN